MAGLTRRTAFGFGAESQTCPNCGFNCWTPPRIEPSRTGGYKRFGVSIWQGNVESVKESGIMQELVQERMMFLML